MSSLVKPMRFEEMADFLASRKTEAYNLYQKHTARQLAAHYGIMYNNNWQKACFRILSDKGMGLGGARNYAKPKNHRKKSLSDKTTIVVGLSQEAMKAFRKLKAGESYTKLIERLLLEYDKTL